MDLEVKRGIALKLVEELKTKSEEDVMILRGAMLDDAKKQ